MLSLPAQKAALQAGTLDAGSGQQPPHRFVTHLPFLPKTSLSRSQHSNCSQKLDQFAVQMGVLAGHSAKASCMPQHALSLSFVPSSASLQDLAFQSLRKEGIQKRKRKAK